MNRPTVESSKQTNPHPDKNHQPGWLETALYLGIGAINTGKVTAEIALEIGKITSKPLLQWVEDRTRDAGEAAMAIGKLPPLNNPVVQRFAGVLRLDWLVGLTQHVNLDKARTEVEQLQHQYPQESPAELAHRLMVNKAIAASGIGFASSILPGFATALLALDLAATMALQTEMVYQIAAIYGLDLSDPARKGEVLAIFGLALGGSNALKAGLGFLRNIPMAGAMIGAGTDATMVYSLGYAACRYYEVKLQNAGAEPTAQALESLQRENEKYLDTAIAQQALADQILVHMILASYPQKAWSDIHSDLQARHLEPASLERLAVNIQSPQPLETLLSKLNQDYALPLLTQCQQIAELDEVVTEEEAKVLHAIARKSVLGQHDQ